MSLKSKMIRDVNTMLGNTNPFDPETYGLHKLTNIQLDSLRSAIANLSNKVLSNE